MFDLQFDQVFNLQHDQEKGAAPELRRVEQTTAKVA
jgi:hypothetical protein